MLQAIRKTMEDSLGTGSWQSFRNSFMSHDCSATVLPLRWQAPRQTDYKVQNLPISPWSPQQSYLHTPHLTLSLQGCWYLVTLCFIQERGVEHLDKWSNCDPVALTVLINGSDCCRCCLRCKCNVNDMMLTLNGDNDATNCQRLHCVKTAVPQKRSI